MSPFRKQHPMQKAQNPNGSGRPALDVADFFIHRCGYIKTHLQIQKLAYIAHGHMLAIHGKPLFKDRVEAWDLGPVIPAVYKEFKKWGHTPIGRVSGKSSMVQFDPAEESILESIFRSYSQYCGYFLVQLTHGDKNKERKTPWKECYVKGGNNVIPDSVTKAYYGEIIAS